MKDIKTIKELCQHIAHASGWDKIAYQQTQQMVSFKKNGIRINVYLTKMTVAIAPSGQKQHYVKNVTDKILIDIFNHPMKRAPEPEKKPVVMTLKHKEAEELRDSITVLIAHSFKYGPDTEGEDVKSAGAFLRKLTSEIEKP